MAGFRQLRWVAWRVRLSLTAVALGSMAVASSARAHARLDPSKKLKPRSTSSGLKTGPCGGIAATSERATYAPGETITIAWQETINHPGYFRLAFSPSGETGFDANVLKDDITDTQNGSVSFADPSTYHEYSATVQLPETTCESCTIQLIQVMLDNPMSPSNYYSCADLRIVEGGGDDTPEPTDDGGTDGGDASDDGGAGDGAGELPDRPDAPGDFTVKVRSLETAPTEEDADAKP